MGFVVGYAPCGLSPQIDGMPVILKKTEELILLSFLFINCLSRFILNSLPQRTLRSLFLF